MEEKILQILMELRPEFDFKKSDNFIEDGYLDSFDVVTLVSEIENTFGIVINPMDILPDNFSSLSNMAELMKNSK